MHDPQTPGRTPPQGPEFTGPDSGINRRRFVGAATGAVAGAFLTAPALAAAQSDLATPSQGSPITSPVVSNPVDVEALYTLSQQLVGSDDLDRKAADALAALIGADPAHAAGFEELVALEKPGSRETLKGVSSDASALATSILTYWYLGMFDGRPVEHRADIFFGLAAWKTVPYFTQPTLCKGPGYWATDVQVGE